jgi:hypothetical protein
MAGDIELKMPPVCVIMRVEAAHQARPDSNAIGRFWAPSCLINKYDPVFDFVPPVRPGDGEPSDQHDCRPSLTFPDAGDPPQSAGVQIERWGRFGVLLKVPIYPHRRVV